MTDKYVLSEVEAKIGEIMELLEIPCTPSTEGTPHRIAKMWCNEIFKNRNNANIEEELISKIKLFPNEYHNTDLIVVKDIPFTSTCEHHFMPFIGKVSIGYVPRDVVVGLSKIPRVVKYFSKKPQLQEQFTSEIGTFLLDFLKPYALFVEVEADHTCVLCRGAESPCSTHTSFKWYEEGYFEAYEDFLRRLRGM